LIATDKYKKYNWNDIVEYDPTSPSGLVWKIEIRVGRSYGVLKNKKGSFVGYTRTHKGKSYYIFKYNYDIFYAHRVIASLFNEVSTEMVINHIDGNGLNNTLENLEICTQSKNSILRKQNVNREIKGKNKSGYVGIFYVLSHGKMPVVRACWSDINGKKISKEFSINKYGEQKALELALEARKLGNELTMTQIEKERENA